MKVPRTLSSGLLVLALALAVTGVLVAGAAAGRAPNTTAGATAPTPAGTTVAAAASAPTPPALLPPPRPPGLPPNVPAPPTPRLTDPDLTSARPPQGVPAITPRVPALGPDSPAFTEDDVRAYIAKYGTGAGRVKADGPFDIESIAFLRRGEIPVRLGIAAGGADDQLVCTAKLRGTFLVFGPSQTYTKSTLILIFDARTGHSLEQVALP